MHIAVLAVECLLFLSVYAQNQSNFANRVDKFQPGSFLLGVGSTAQRCEGAMNKDGRGESVWDIFVRDNEHKIKRKSDVDFDLCPDTYDNLERDIENIKFLKVDCYSFSICWSRILPDGKNVNRRAIRYYKDLIKALKEIKVVPTVTLMELDFPKYVLDKGGFLNENVHELFKAYADVVFSNFAKDVEYFITFEDPYLLCNNVYGHGYLKPTIKPKPGRDQYRCGEMVLRSHATAYHLYKDKYKRKHKGSVGISLCSSFYFADDEEEVNRALAFQFGWFAHPLCSEKGNYPEIMIDDVSRLSDEEGLEDSRLPRLSPYWIQRMRYTCDFLKVNYYTSLMVTPLKKQLAYKELGAFAPDACQSYRPRFEWSRGSAAYSYAWPRGVRHLLNYIKKEFGNPRLMLRLGWSNHGEQHDTDRVIYFQKHLPMVLDAIYKDKVNLFCLIAWSLYDQKDLRDGLTTPCGFWAITPNTTTGLTPKYSMKFWRQLCTTRCVP